MGIFGELWRKISGSGEKNQDSISTDTATDQPSTEPGDVSQEPAAPAEGGEKEAPTINPQSEAEPSDQSEGGAEGEEKKL